MNRKQKYNENEALESHFRIKEENTAYQLKLSSIDSKLDIYIEEDDVNPENRLYGDIRNDQHWNIRFNSKVV